MANSNHTERQAVATAKWRTAHPEQVRASRAAYREKNREKLAEQRRLYYQANRPRLQEYGRQHGIERRYGITPEDFEARLASQGGGCAVCGSVVNLVIDHDHSCCAGRLTCGACVRGILCGSCNLSLGHAGDSPVRLEELAGYLRAYSQ